MPGIEVTNDPLMQARLFSYLDTQLTRLGGPNFSQLPINRPHCPVNDMLRDGMHQTAIHTGVAAYHPNSIDGDEPEPADEKHGGYVQTPRRIEGTAVRAQPVSFDDHFSQATMFYRSLSRVEQAHIVEAFTFELGKVYEQAIKERELQVLANVDTDLCEQVAAGLGLPAPKGKPAAGRHVSPALVQILAEPGPDRRPQDRHHRRRGLRPRRHRQTGQSGCGAGRYRAGHRTRRRRAEGGSAQRHRRPDAGHGTLDRVRRARRGGGTAPIADIKLVVLLQEAFRHCKPIAAWGSGARLLELAGIPHDGAGVLLSTDVDKKFTAALIAAVGLHRVWDRAPAVMASAVAPSKR